MYENISLPVSGSEDSSEILHHVGELASWADAMTHLLFVAGATRDSVTVIGNTVVNALIQEGEDIAKDVSKTSSTLGVEYEIDVVQRNPAPTIVEYADRYGHDLIAMSTHGRRGMSRYLQGSVSEKVVHLSSVPVPTARAQPDEQLVSPYEDVLVTTSGSVGATQAAQHGLTLAGSPEATVRVPSVINDASLSLDIRSTIPGQEHERAATEVAREIIEDAEAYGVTDTVQHIEQGDSADVIFSCIDAGDIHVVVMGITGRCDTGRILLGSVAEKTIRSVPVPALMIGGVE